MKGGSPRYMAPECHDSTLGPLSDKAGVLRMAMFHAELTRSNVMAMKYSHVNMIVIDKGHTNIILRSYSNTWVLRSLNITINSINIKWCMLRPHTSC